MGNLGESIYKTFETMWSRFTYGGDTGKDQRIYYFNLKEIMDNKYGTANPEVFFRPFATKTSLSIASQ